MDINTADAYPLNAIPENINTADYLRNDVFPEELFPLRQYTLKKILGQGAYGIVYLAEHRETKRNVALKIIRKVFETELSIEKERVAFKTLCHRHIAKLHQEIDTVNYTCFVLEQIKGGNLENFMYVETEDKLLQIIDIPRAQAKRFFAHLISGVHYMHKKNLVHRDLKLANLLITERDDIIITDFGLSGSTLKNGDKFYTNCFTSYYAPPEVGLDRNNIPAYTGVKGDIWSCGVILYLLLYKFFPFTNATNGINGRIIEDCNIKLTNPDYYYQYLRHTTLLVGENGDGKEDTEIEALLRGMLAYNANERFTTDNIVASPWLKDYEDLFNIDLMEEKEKKMEPWDIPNEQNTDVCVGIQDLKFFDTINPPDIPFKEVENEDEIDPLFLSEDQVDHLKSELGNRIQQQMSITTTPDPPVSSTTSSKQVSEKQQVDENQTNPYVSIIEAPKTNEYISTKEHQITSILKQLGKYKQRSMRYIRTTNILGYHDNIDSLSQSPSFNSTIKSNATASTFSENLMVPILSELNNMDITYKKSDHNTIECIRPKLARPWTTRFFQSFKQRQVIGKEGYDFGGKVKFTIELIDFESKFNFNLVDFSLIGGDNDTFNYIRYKILKSLHL